MSEGQSEAWGIFKTIIEIDSTGAKIADATGDYCRFDRVSQVIENTANVTDQTKQALIQCLRKEIFQDADRVPVLLLGIQFGIMSESRVIDDTEGLKAVINNIKSSDITESGSKDRN